MREIISYQAVDGKLFNSKEKCIEYEQQYYSYRTEISVNVEFLDYLHRHIDEAPVATDEYYEQRLEDAYNRSEYIIIHNDLSDEAANFLQNEMGWDFPRKRGEYRYNTDASEWVTLTEDLMNFCKLWGMTTREIIKRFTP